MILGFADSWACFPRTISATLLVHAWRLCLACLKCSTGWQYYSSNEAVLQDLVLLCIHTPLIFTIFPTCCWEAFHDGATPMLVATDGTWGGVGHSFSPIRLETCREITPDCPAWLWANSRDFLQVFVSTDFLVTTFSYRFDWWKSQHVQWLACGYLASRKIQKISNQRKNSFHSNNNVFPLI